LSLHARGDIAGRVLPDAQHRDDMAQNDKTRLPSIASYRHQAQKQSPKFGHPGREVDVNTKFSRRTSLRALPAIAASGAVLLSAGDLSAAEETVQMLFVQSADGVRIADGKLTLVDVSTNTIFFSDRPARVAGHMTTEEFVPFWGEGTDSFSKDPPNATLSVFTEGEPTNLVVTISNPVLSDDDLNYDIVVLEGSPPAEGGECSLFIDVIGMPLTPMSYAGVARRTTRRAIVYGRL
jgi:hypothetical protein